MKKYNFTTKAIASGLFGTLKSDFKKLGAKFSLSLATFALGAMLVMNIAGTNAVAPTVDPPDGEINATFDNVEVKNILHSYGMSFGRLTTPGDPLSASLAIDEHGLLFSPSTDHVSIGENLGVDGDLITTGNITTDSITIPSGGLSSLYLGPDGIGTILDDGTVISGAGIPFDGALEITGGLSVYRNREDMGVTNPYFAIGFNGELSNDTSDHLTIQDNLLTAGNITVTPDYSIGSFSAVTTYNEDSASYILNKSISISASCPAGTFLSGCTGNASGKSSFSYIGSFSIGDSCFSYAKRILDDSQPVRHTAQAICFDPTRPEDGQTAAEEDTNEDPEDGEGEGNVGGLNTFTEIEVQSLIQAEFAKLTEVWEPQVFEKVDMLFDPNPSGGVSKTHIGAFMNDMKSTRAAVSVNRSAVQGLGSKTGLSSISNLSSFSTTGLFFK